jgi:hypothetical protein
MNCARAAAVAAVAAVVLAAAAAAGAAAERAKEKFLFFDVNWEPLDPCSSSSSFLKGAATPHALSLFSSCEKPVALRKRLGKCGRGMEEEKGESSSLCRMIVLSSLGRFTTPTPILP